jgi:hypothetical protein
VADRDSNDNSGASDAEGSDQKLALAITDHFGVQNILKVEMQQ